MLCRNIIPIHLPRVGARTAWEFYQIQQANISIHLLRAEQDFRIAEPVAQVVISIHSPLRGETYAHIHCSATYQFQSTRL